MWDASLWKQDPSKLQQAPVDDIWGGGVGGAIALWQALLQQLQEGTQKHDNQIKRQSLMV